MIHISNRRLRATAALTLTFLLAACGKPEEPAHTAKPAMSESGTASSAQQASNLRPEDCERLADPKPADESAAARATAVSQGVAARQACKKAAQNASTPNQANADLARIREIKENEESERVQRKVTEAQWKEGLRRGANAPLRELKY